MSPQSIRTPRALLLIAALVVSLLVSVGIGATATQSAAIAQPLDELSPITLYNVPGATFTEIADINNNGDVAGKFVTGGQIFGFTLSAAGNLVTYPEGFGGITAINDFGQVAGTYRLVSDGAAQPFFGDAGTVTTDIATPGNSIVTGLNNSGQMVGYYFDGNDSHAFVRYEDGSVVSLNQPGATYNQVYAINDSGIVAGGFRSADGSYQYYTRDISQGEITLLPTLRAGFPQIKGLNNEGTIVADHAGISGDGWLLFSPDGNVDELGPEGTSSATVFDINDHGDVVGYKYEGEERLAFVRSANGVYRDFGRVDGATTGRAINDLGQIVGFHVDDAGTRTGFITGVTSSKTCGGIEVTVDIGAGQTPTAGNDVILGTPGDDVIRALGGDDLVCGGDGNDIVLGGPGDDTLIGDNGDDRLYGQTGRDHLFGNDGGDVLGGGSGDDYLDGQDGPDRLYGGTGHDNLDGGHGADLLFGQNGNDVLEPGLTGPDRLEGGADDDLLEARAANSPVVLLGGDGNDRLLGGRHADRIFGQGGNDLLNGGDGDDFLHGGAGNDRLFGRLGLDRCNGSSGTADAASECEVVANIP